MQTKQTTEVLPRIRGIDWTRCQRRAAPCGVSNANSRRIAHERHYNNTREENEMYREDRTLNELGHHHNLKSQARHFGNVSPAGGVPFHRAASGANVQVHEGDPATNGSGSSNQAYRLRRFSSTNPVFRRLTYPATQLGPQAPIDCPGRPGAVRQERRVL